MARFSDAVWQTSNDVVYRREVDNSTTKLLRCPTMGSGIHKWSIRVEEWSEQMEVGVASTAHEPEADGVMMNAPFLWKCRCCLTLCPSFSNARSFFFPGKEDRRWDGALRRGATLKTIHGVSVRFG
jgi:hypothetical protein